MDPGIDDLMADVADVVHEKRTSFDRYREFREVFLQSDQGKRVLNDILVWGHVWQASVVGGDPHMTYFKEGERNLSLKILHTVHNQPVERPTKQNTKQGDV